MPPSLKNRRKSKKVERDGRYEDIFSTVVENAFLIPTAKMVKDEPLSSTSSSPGKDLEFACDCGQCFDKHILLHQHIAAEHKNGVCRECGTNTRAIRYNNVCNICGSFALKIEEHLKLHYQDRTTNNALMECRKCYRSFPTIKEVREHEKLSHGPVRPKKSAPKKLKCTNCNEEFHTRHLRDQHVLTHYGHIMGDMWQKLDKVQQNMCVQLNECPLCGSITSSRKSFRLHIINKHLLVDPCGFVEGLNMGTMIKQEVKTEPIEDVPIIKEEPIDASYEQSISQTASNSSFEDILNNVKCEVDTDEYANSQSIASNDVFQPTAVIY